MAIAEQIGTRPDIAALRRAVTGLPWPALLYLICVVTPLWFNAGPLKLSVLRMVLLLLTVPLLVQLLMGRFGRVLITDILILLHIFWIAVTLGINNPNFMLSQVGSVGVEFLGGYLVARAYVRTPEAFLSLCRWVVLVVVCMLPFALTEALTGKAPIIQAIRALPGIDSVDLGHQPKRLGMDRAQVVFAHPIHFGLFCSVSVSLVFVALKDVMSTSHRWILAILSGLVGFLALSSGALLAIFLQVAMIAWAALFNRIKWRWWLLVGMFALAWVAIDILSNRSPMRVFMSYATFSAHNAYWRSIIFEWGMKNVWDHPIFGLGLNDWVRPAYMFSGSMDNFWLVMAVRHGIPGFLFLATGYAWAIFLIMRRNFDDVPVLRNIRRAWVFTFLGLSFTLATVHIWASIYSFVFFMFGTGMWLITVQASPPDTDAKDDPDPGRGRFRMRRSAGAGQSYTRFPAGSEPVSTTSARQPQTSQQSSARAAPLLRTGPAPTERATPRFRRARRDTPR